MKLWNTRVAPFIVMCWNDCNILKWLHIFEIQTRPDKYNNQTGNPAAEGAGYFFINKISKFQSFIVLGGLKCEKLVNNVIKVTKKKTNIIIKQR